MHWNSTPVTESAAPGEQREQHSRQSRVKENFVVGRESGERPAEFDVGAADERRGEGDRNEDGEGDPDAAGHGLLIEIEGTS